MSNQNTKKIILGVCGGIAAYKSCEIVRLFIKQGFDVHVMMTKGAQNFITAMTLQTLSRNEVHSDIFNLSQESHISHIQLADQANAIVIAPATADVLAKAAHGLCDDIVTTVLLATKAPVLFAPSMNVNMYQNKLTQENIKKLKSLGYHFIDPEDGDLACGWEGPGRLAEPQKIVENTLLFFK